MVAQQPQLWKNRNLPPPHLYFNAMLYISPVLATKPYDELEMQLLSSHSSDTVPSLKRSASTSSSSSTRPSPKKISSASLSSMEGLSEASKTEPKSISLLSSPHSPSSPPQWLTSQVVKTVFGDDGALSIPSPIHTYQKSPSIPHIFVGCRHEMFGLNWLDLFFCSPLYNDLLIERGVDSRYVSVDSDHWNILNSDGLSKALQKELEHVADKSSMMKK